MRKIKLGDVLNVKRGMSLSGDYYSETGEIIRLTLGNFDYPACGFKENKSKSDIYFTGPIRSEFLLKKGDIITPLTEQVRGLLGNTATIPNDNLYIQSGDIGLVIPDESKIDKRFAYYLVSSAIVKKQLDAGSQQTKIRHTSPDAIKECIAWIPQDINKQRRIAKLMDDINERISNNNAINAELEAMAKTMYDYWFLQFEFPNENGKPYKSSGGKMVYNEELKREIPEGWEVKSIFDAADVIYGYPLSTERFTEKDGLPVVRIRDIVDNSVSANTTEEVENKYLTATKDLLIGMDGNFHMNFWPRKGDCVNQRIVRVRSNGKASTLQIYFEIYPFIKQREQNAARSTVGHLSDKDMKQLRILITNNESINNTFEDILFKVCLNKKENQELASLRDFLLPLLMNGQVGFKEKA